MLDPRHNQPLADLERDLDQRFRPDVRLRRLLTGSAGGLDRPIVPLLNALVAHGLQPRSSCADSYVSVQGHGPAQLDAMLRIGRVLPLRAIEWTWMNTGETRTVAQWAGGPAGAVSPQAGDRGLLAAAAAIAARPLADAGGEPFLCEMARAVSAIDPYDFIVARHATEWIADDFIRRTGSGSSPVGAITDACLRPNARRPLHAPPGAGGLESAALDIGAIMREIGVQGPATFSRFTVTGGLNG